MKNKKAYNKFLEFVKYQGGDIKKLKIDAKIKVVKSEKNGMLKTIDYSAGVKLYKNIGDKVKVGDILATLYTNKNIKIEDEDINCFVIE